MGLRSWIKTLLGRGQHGEITGSRKRGPATHVVILDGTMSSLEPGHETHAGQLYKLLKEAGTGANLTATATGTLSSCQDIRAGPMPSDPLRG